MKRIFVLNAIALGLLCMSQISNAKQTRYMPDDFNGGWHPELLGQATCLPYDRNSTHYTTQTTSGRTYSVGLNGLNEMYGTIFGSSGSGFYEADGRKYFVGPYAGQYGTGPKGSETAYSYQICYVNAAPVEPHQLLHQNRQ